ncbi:MAG: hypothetical protein A2511_09965 [Deltaproteobacteria bacterium RIFOXYD12_FULL_50_9]|nr:MAG: hypothetical protein A2511_09965 [Deltaproteobacteria bacterium RIFOXYD12_FULL_50_9]
MLLFACTNAYAADVKGKESSKNYYDRAKEGWYWYEDPPAKVEPEDIPKEITPPEKQTRPVPTMENHTMDDLWNMHPDDFQALLKDFQKKAVQYPTEQNVVEYYTMQDIARRKSVAYANVAGYVTQKYTSFDMNATAPTVTPGQIAKTQMQNKEVQSTIANAQGDHALLFFTQKGCSFCDKQKNILRFFNDKYGWPIKELDIRENPDIAVRFNITTTPTLLLIGKGKDNYLPVSVGVASMDAIEQKLYRGVRLLGGKITPEEYSTFDYQKSDGGDPKAILQNNLNQSKQKKTRLP